MIELANPPLPDSPMVIHDVASLLDHIRLLTEMDVRQFQVVDDRAGSGGWLIFWWLR